MTEDDLGYLNMARRWWQAVWTPADGPRHPADAEVGAAYRRYHAEGFVLWHRLDECDAPDLCRYHKDYR